MIKLRGWNRLYAVFILGAAALSVYGVSNVVSAYNDAQISQSSIEAVSDNTLLSKGYEPGSPYCNPAGCAACRGCAGLQYSQNVDEVKDSAVQVTLVD
jgi:hypothetical protein